jgi:hypothetical protein
MPASIERIALRQIFDEVHSTVDVGPTAWIPNAQFRQLV